MGGYRTALAAVLLVAACGGNPFIEVDDDGTPLDPEDPNTSVNSKFAWDPERNLTMNSVRYDSDNDQLVINNLPFDGPDGVYRRISGAGASNVPGITRGVFESQRTATTGQIKYYAMFVRGDYLEASAAAGRDWGGFGYAGANINRASFRLPASGEYVYRGVYGGTRTFDNGGGIELITGNVELLLDVDDLDPSGGIQGAIVGDVYNRARIAPSTRSGGALPDISLQLVSFNTATGTWEAGSVQTESPGGRVRDRGLHEGILGGPNGEELGGYLIMEGVADVQRTRVESVSWTLTVTTPIVIDGLDTGTFLETRTSGVVSGLDQTSRELLQQTVNAGGVIPAQLLADRSVIPPDAIIGPSSFTALEFSTDFNAREVGVFVSDVVTP